MLLLWFHPNTEGNPFAWADTLGGKGTSHGNSIAVDGNDNLYVCGQTDGVFRAGNININGKNNFLIKYNAQGMVLWAKSLPGLVCKCVAVDPNGNPCIAGYFFDTVIVSKYTLISVGLNDFFAMKFDSLGNILWANSGGGSGNDIALAIACDVDGNTNITGSFEDYMDFGPNNSLLSLGKGDMFVAQYDSLGNFYWATGGGSNGEDAGTAIGADLTGNVFVTGFFNSTATFQNGSIASTGGMNMFIAKYNPYGFQQYIQPVNCNTDIVPNGIGLDGSGNVYISGTFNGTAIFGNKTITSTRDDGFVAAYDNNLNINWLNKMGGPGNDAALGIVSDPESNIFVTGVFTGNSDFSGSNLTSEGNTDIFLAKYDAAGRLLWTERAGGGGADSAFSVCVDRNDIASITGFIGANADFGNIHLAVDSNGSFFIAQAKPDPSGIKVPVENAGLFDVYPNPSVGIFNIRETFSTDKEVSMTLTDMAGRIIGKGISNPHMMDLSSYPDGIYFLMIETVKGRYLEKLVKAGG